ncbi:site-specific integrase [Microvirga sp. VF16]|uniref:site-specific integrase n=1 Tax=Microvirga sp. VF16 TaxID=2807101 RepID=UPI00193DEFB5|nr:site-specific integrase [Microvirga sp. VF16]QRM35126.1 tyrosine-type recombinase/integrase [Microvirga sp. VF16]
MGQSAVGNPASQNKRARALDALASVLPMSSADRYAEVLTDADVATLKHLADAGMGANTLRALASDLAYLEAWSHAATGRPLPWSADRELVLKFIAHHLWDPDQKAVDPTHGMPDDVIEELWDRKILKIRGPHAPKTVSRRLSNWSTLHQWKGVEGPFDDPGIKKAVRLAMKASGREPQRKSRKPVTRDVLKRLLATCAGTKAIDLRDRAILLIAFAAGGRRRSEVASLRHSQISIAEPIKLRPADPASPTVPCVRIALGRTKTTTAGQGAFVFAAGPAALALHEWMQFAEITTGPVFPEVRKDGSIGATPLTPQSINLILKKRCRLAGLDPADFSSHGLRSGFMTQAGRDGIPLVDAMRQSAHKSVQQAAGYYDEQEHAQSKSVRIFT